MIFSEIQNELMTLCVNDDVGLWVVAAIIEDTIGDKDPENIKLITLQTVEKLLDEGLIIAGCPHLSENGEYFFEKWGLAVQETIAKIAKEWDDLGREPTLGDIVWFIASEKGREKFGKD